MDNSDGKLLNVTFLNHDFPESPLNRSIANYHEAGRVCDIVADLLYSNPTLLGKDIGVIAPYVAQIRTISDYLKVEPERQRAFSAWLGHERAAEIQDIEIKTVDGFEGREKDVIIFSTVRSNPEGYIGFLADWRRLNVGLTRAKRALVMLGSARTLAAAKTGQYASDALPRDGARVWRAFIRWLRGNCMVMDDRS
jgi:superfamily I DNA and/or RNA helicase